MTKPQIESSKKKPIVPIAVGVVSLILAVFAGNLVLQGMKEAKIQEQEKQAVIEAEQKNQAAIQKEQDRLATIRRRQTAEQNEQERLANLKAEAEIQEQERLAAIEAEKRKRTA